MNNEVLTTTNLDLPSTPEYVLGLDMGSPEGDTAIVHRSGFSQVVTPPPAPEIAVPMPTPETPEERVARLGRELEVNQFRTVLKDPEARKHADKVLAQFTKGTLPYKSFAALAPQVQRLYYEFHGYVPVDPVKLKLAERTRNKARTRRKLAKKAKLRNRR